MLSIRTQWYVIYAKARREEYAQSALARKGLEVLFPRLVLTTPGSRERAIVPLFPRYLFVKLETPQHYHDARWSPGVHSIVNVAGVPSALEEEVVDFLRRQANPEGLIVARRQLAVGQEVSITDGPFAGLKAIIEDPPDAKGRVRVLMTLLNRPVRVALATLHVESPWIVGA